MSEEQYRDRARAESFGSVAAQYDRARPTYPDALLDAIATRGGTDVLDVGCGTGIAARLLAARGLSVLGVEVDPAMAAVARGHGLDVEVGAFETWDDAGRRFDMLTCAQAWHWVDPVAGAAKAVRVLRPGGTVALFWNVHLEDVDVQAALDLVYAEHAPSIADTGGWAGTGEHQVTRYVDPLEAAGFGDVALREFRWDKVYDRAALLDLLPTHSDHHLLPAPRLAAVLDGVGEVVDSFGGTITSHYTTQLILGRAPA